MNKKLLLIGGALIVSIGFTACGGGAPAPKEKADFRCRQEGVLAPGWTCRPYKAGGIVALGIAQKNVAGDYGMQLEEAEANGRTALARRVASKVKTMMKNWKRITGAGKDQTYEKNVESVSKQTANQTLNGSRTMESWTSPKSGTLYILIGMNTEAVGSAIGKNIKTSFKNEKALYQQFKAKQADGELDKELAKP